MNACKTLSPEGEYMPTPGSVDSQKSDKKLNFKHNPVLSKRFKYWSQVAVVVAGLSLTLLAFYKISQGQIGHSKVYGDIPQSLTDL